MSERDLEIRTPYDGVRFSKVTPLDRAGIIVSGAVIFLFAQGFASDYIEDTYGIDVYQFITPKGIFEPYGLFAIVYGFAAVVGYLSYLLYRKIVSRKRARFARAFVENPRCYNCGYHIPGIFRDQETGDPDDLVVTCPECGAACPVVCMKDGKLVPVRARRDGA